MGAVKTNDYEVGETVQMNSGGPVMTVCETGFEDEVVIAVKCAWFHTDGKLEVALFDTKCIFRARKP